MGMGLTNRQTKKKRTYYFFLDINFFDVQGVTATKTAV